MRLAGCLYQVVTNFGSSDFDSVSHAAYYIKHLEVDADDEHKARELALMKEQSGDVCDYSYEDESLFVYSLKGSRRKK